MEKIRTCLKGAHPPTCFVLAFNSTATDAKMGVPFYTSLYIFTILKFIPAVRNMLWTKEMHHALRFRAWDNCEKWVTWKKTRTWKEFWSQHWILKIPNSWGILFYTSPSLLVVLICNHWSPQPENEEHRNTPNFSKHSPHKCLRQDILVTPYVFYAYSSLFN